MIPKEITSQKTATHDEVRALSLSPPLRILLLGKSGVGKSATGNSILGINQFTMAMPEETHVTEEYKSATAESCGRQVCVIDTPDLLNPELSEEKVISEREKIISLTEAGLHAFLLVIPVGHVVTNEQEVLETVRQMFGDGALAYTFVLFTRGADLKDGETIEEYIQTQGEELQQLVQDCGGGAHVVDNKNHDTISSQVSDLLDKIDAAVKKNGGNPWKPRGKSQSKETLINFSEASASGLLSDPADEASETKLWESAWNFHAGIAPAFCPIFLKSSRSLQPFARTRLSVICANELEPVSAEKKSPAEIAQLVEVAIREIQEKTMREKVKQVDKSNETATKSEWQDIYAQLLSESQNEIKVSFSDAVSLTFARVSEKIKVTREEKEEAIQAAMAQGVTRAQAVKLCMKATCELARKKMCGVKWNRHDWPSALYADVQAA